MRKYSLNLCLLLLVGGSGNAHAGDESVNLECAIQIGVGMTVTQPLRVNLQRKEVQAGRLLHTVAGVRNQEFGEDRLFRVFRFNEQKIVWGEEVEVFDRETGKRKIEVKRLSMVNRETGTYETETYPGLVGKCKKVDRLL